MAQKLKIVLIFCLTILLSASVPKLIRPIGMPDIGFPTSQLNKDFRIFLIRPLGRPPDIYKGEQRIFFGAVCESWEIIEFNRVDVKAFLYNEGKWLEIKSISLHDPFDELDSLHSGLSRVTINPTELPKPAMLRIFFFTNIARVYTGIDELKMNKKSVSYTDVYLQP